MLKTSKNGIKRRSAKIVAITVLTVVLLMGTTFYSTTEAQAASESEILEDTAIGATAGFVIGSAAADGLGAVVGMGAGAIAGWLYGMSRNGQDNGAISNNAKQAYAEQLFTEQKKLLNLSDSNADNMYQLYNTSKYFFVRKAEWGAFQLYESQKQNGETYTYDGNKIIEDTGIGKDANAYVFSSLNTYSAVINSYRTVGDFFIENYDGMSVQIKAIDDSENVLGRAISDKDNYYIVVYTEMLEKGYYYYISPNSSVYFIAPSNGTYTINPVDEDGNPIGITIDGETYYNKTVTLKAMDYIKANLEPSSSGSHIVKFNSECPSIFSYGVKSLGQQNAYTYMGFLAFNEEKSGSTISNISLKIAAYAEGGDFRFVDGKALSDIDGLQIRDIYGYEGNHEYYWNNLNTGINKAYKIISQVDDMITTANNFASATYHALVDGTENRTLVPPDIIFPDPSQMDNLNATEAYAVLVAYLRAMYMDLQNNSKLDYHNVNISKQSFENLRVIGTVERNGTYIIGTNTTDAVFIPYISIQDMNLTLGNNTMQQNGFALVLKNSWNKNTTAGMTMDQIRYVPLLLNDTIHIDAIEINGQPRSYVNLNVTKLKFVVPQLSSPAAPPQFEQLAQAMVGWMKQHILTTSFLAAGIGALVFMPAPSNKTWGFILLAGAAAMYFVVEPAIASFTSDPLRTLGLFLNYWRW